MSPFASASEEPFGKPDGSSDDIESAGGRIVSFPTRFGGISRDPSDARVRVVIGQLGSGKSLHLRRMQDHIAQERGSKGQVASEVETSAELTTRSIRKFAEMLKLSGGNTEDWKVLWRRGIIRSAATYLLFSKRFAGAEDDEARAFLRKNLRFLGAPAAPHKVTQEVETVINSHQSADSLRRYLFDKRWADVDYFVAQALTESAGLYLYIDDVDKNFRWAPSLWIQAQRGLFYTVMDLLRDDHLRSKLHVVMALRDIAFSSIKVSEQASRYLDLTHINILSWRRASMQYLLEAKIRTLPAGYFSDPSSKTIESWLGCSMITNRRRDSEPEPVDMYLIRHTSMVPRDLIRMGNALCAEIRGLDGDKPSQEQIRQIVSGSGAEAGTRQAAQCANQVLSDIIPSDAYARDYDHIYLEPNAYALQEARDFVFDCISLTGSETFAKNQLTAMNQRATELFASDQEVRMCDIFWQQGLLGYIDDEGSGHFYRVDSMDGSSLTLPKHAKISTFVWNPLVFDLQLGMDTTLPSPVWPG